MALTIGLSDLGFGRWPRAAGCGLWAISFGHWAAGFMHWAPGRGVWSLGFRHSVFGALWGITRKREGQNRWPLGFRTSRFGLRVFDFGL